METDVERYAELLNRLKKNRENVPRELLLSQYKKPYGKLKRDAEFMTVKIFKDVVTRGLRIKQCDAVATYAVINDAIEESGVLRRVGRAIGQGLDADQVLSYADKLKDVVRKRLDRLG